jgi:hypothetical protein
LHCSTVGFGCEDGLLHVIVEIDELEEGLVGGGRVNGGVVESEAGIALHRPIMRVVGVWQGLPWWSSPSCDSGRLDMQGYRLHFELSTSSTLLLR